MSDGWHSTPDFEIKQIPDTEAIVKSDELEGMPIETTPGHHAWVLSIAHRITAKDVRKVTGADEDTPEEDLYHSDPADVIGIRINCGVCGLHADDDIEERLASRCPGTPAWLTWKAEP